MMLGNGWLCLFFLGLAHVGSAQVIPASTSQCVLGLADGWDSSRVTLSLHEKKDGQWRQVGESWPARLGKDGLAWGRGMHLNPKAALIKREGDWKAPAGVFAIGGVWGYDKSIRKHEAMFYRRITERDLWVEDVESSHYNRHLVLDHQPRTAWEKKQQMKQNDPAHALKLFIAHNAPPRVEPGGGSAIFFHIWRDGGNRPSAGCTTMAEIRLRWMIAQLDPGKRPVYVLLPTAEYQKYRDAWKLP